MFPFRHIVHANDTTIKEYVRVASRIGVEGANWTYEWADGGRAIFAFLRPSRARANGRHQPQIERQKRAAFRALTTRPCSRSHRRSPFAVARGAALTLVISAGLLAGYGSFGQDCPLKEPPLRKSQ
jgi:hypothetical protein